MEGIYVAVFCISFIITFISILFLRPFAIKMGVLDVPNGTLKIHKQPVPYLGGVAIFCGTFPFLIFLAQKWIDGAYMLLGLVVLLIVGLIDDIYSITPFQKTIGQIIAGIFFIKADLCFTASSITNFVPFLGVYFSSKVLTLVALGQSLFWILSIINACNLIDIMDGLLAVVGMTTLFSWLVVGVLTSLNIYFMVVIIAFFGSLAAFFWFNKPNALLYSGDAGALFLGGFLSILPFLVYRWQEATTKEALFLPLFIFLVLILEICILIGIRIKKGIPFYCGSPDHFVCYLKKDGWEVWKILKLVIILSLFFGVTGIFVVFSKSTTNMLFFIFPLLCFLWIIIVFNKTLSFFMRKSVVFFQVLLRFCLNIR